MRTPSKLTIRLGLLAFTQVACGGAGDLSGESRFEDRYEQVERSYDVARTESCPGGGVLTYSGADSNGDGILSPGESESSLTRLKCAPAPGPITLEVVTAGGRHSCGLTMSGGVKCWGDNRSGQLGDGTTIGSGAPVDVLGLNSGVASIAAGDWHTCAIMEGGEAKCWGDNSYGQLGDGSLVDSSTPVDVLELEMGVASISTGGAHTCAVTVEGAAACWGDNTNGELGDGSSMVQTRPVTVQGLNQDVSSISASLFHTCAVTSSGGAKCWGRNDRGEVGDGTTQKRRSPVDVMGLTSGVTSISTGTDFTCAITDAGSARCWGDNTNGELGDGTDLAHSTPVDVSMLRSRVTSISCGSGYTCAMTAEGGVCWGNDRSDIFGEDETPFDRFRERGIVYMPWLDASVRVISTGKTHACFVTESFEVKCWGDNSSGGLGMGYASGTQALPVNVVTD